MKTSTKDYLIQSRDDKWAKCSVPGSLTLPKIVLYSAQVIVEILEDRNKVLKDPKQDGRILVIPEPQSMPTAKRLSGVSKDSLTAMMLAILGVEDAKSRSTRLCFGYSDVDSGFYVGHDSRDFTDVTGI